MKNGHLKIWILVCAFFSILACAVALLYAPRKLRLTSDAAYFWKAKEVDSGEWVYREFATGHKYFLYLPEKYRGDKDNPAAKLPLIVTFHGSMESSGVSKYGRLFTDSEFQREIYPEGCAVLCVLARIGYFTDTHSMSLLIQNVLLAHRCLDPAKVVAYGFSQGAAYAVELACREPRLFRAVVSGSGYYKMNLLELLSVLPVSFYFATSRNDAGIYEQGSATGKACALLCRNSRYVEYAERGHFWVLPDDSTGRGDESMRDWLCAVIRAR